MKMEYITLIILVIAILVGYFRNVNTGLVGILFAFFVGIYFIKMSPKEVIAGFPTSTIFTLMGMTFLFSVAKVNRTLENVALSIARLARGNTKLIPVLFFLISLILAAVGPGPVVMVAIMAPITMAVGKEEGIPDMLTATSTCMGCLAGGLTAITPSGIIASSLGLEQGISNYTPVFISCLLVSTIQFVLFYVIFGGLKLKRKETGSEKKNITFDRNQIITLAVIAVTLLAIMGLKTDTGLTAFCGGTLLLIIGVADEKKSIAGISWSTILLVMGMAILVNVVTAAGGIDALTAALSKISGPKTAAPILCVIAGLMSAVSSASGVVMPTLIPTIGGMVQEAGGAVSATALLSAIVIGSHAVTCSPLSTLGAMSLAAANEDTNKQKMFAQLMIVGFGSIIIAAILGAVGLFYLG